MTGDAVSRRSYIEVDIHHIIPWAKCHVHEYDNLIALCPNCHRRADSGEIDRKALRLYKLNLRFAHDKYSQTELDILFELYKRPIGYEIQWPPANLILLKRIQEARLIETASHPGGVVKVNGMDIGPVLLNLTPKGRAFLDELGVKEL